MKFKLGDTVYLVYENLILKGFIVNIDEKENEWSDNYYDINVSQSNYLTEISDVVHNLLEHELFTNIEDLFNSLKIDLDNRLIRKSL